MSTILRTFASLSRRAFCRMFLVSTSSKQPGIGESGSTCCPILPSSRLPNSGFWREKARNMRHSRNSCSSSPLSPPSAPLPSLTRASLLDATRVESTWSARMKIRLIRDMGKASVASSQSSDRLVSSVDCNVIAALAEPEPAEPDLEYSEKMDTSSEKYFWTSAKALSSQTGKP